MRRWHRTTRTAVVRWKRSSRADTAEGDGTVRSRSRRQRRRRERRSARDGRSRPIACSTAANPPSRSSRSRSSTQSPPARFRKTTASTICTSSQPWRPATWTCRRIAAVGPLPWIRSGYSGNPASDVTPVLERSASYWSPEPPVAASPTPLVMVSESQTQTLCLILQDQRGTRPVLARESGQPSSLPASRSTSRAISV